MIVTYQPKKKPPTVTKEDVNDGMKWNGPNDSATADRGRQAELTRSQRPAPAPSAAQPHRLYHWAHHGGK